MERNALDPREPELTGGGDEGFWDWHRRTIADPIRNAQATVRRYMPGQLLADAGYNNLGRWVDLWPAALAGIRPTGVTGMMRDHIIARQLDRRANKLESAEATSFLFPDEPGLRSAAGVANYNYEVPRPPAANTNKSLQIDNPFSEARLEQTWAKMVEDMRFAEELARRNPKLLRPFEVIPGGKKD